MIFINRATSIKVISNEINYENRQILHQSHRVYFCYKTNTIYMHAVYNVYLYRYKVLVNFSKFVNRLFSQQCHNPIQSAYINQWNKLIKTNHFCCLKFACY